MQVDSKPEELDSSWIVEIIRLKIEQEALSKKESDAGLEGCVSRQAAEGAGRARGEVAPMR